jgi:hypothetical protein
MNGLFLIMSSPRSGSTLLAQCLDSHSAIVVPGETDFLSPAALICSSVHDAGAGRRLLADLIVSTADFRSYAEFLTAGETQAIVVDSPYEFAAIVRAIYAAIAAKTGKRLAGDKSPNDMSMAGWFNALGLLAEPTRVVHLVRDVRDVTESLIRQRWVDGIENHFPRRWVADNLYLPTVLGDRPNYLRVRYEDLVADLPTELRRVCAFLGVEFEEPMLNTGGFHKRYRGVPAHARLYDPVSTAHVGRWKQALSPELADRIAMQAGEGLERFGYSSR